MRRAGWGLPVLAACLLAWEAVCRAGWVSPILLPAPSAVAVAAAREWPQFLAGLGVTLGEILLAAVLSCAGGLAIGLLLGSVRPLGRVVGPLLSAAFAVPHIIWYPLFLAWFGLGTSSKVAYGVFGGVFPIALTTMEAVRQLDRSFVTLARSFGAGNVRIVRSVMVPFMLPSLVSGLRLGISLVVISVIVAEMLSSLGGLGYLVSYYRTTFATGSVYLGILLALCCAGSVNAVLSQVERRSGRWRELEAGEARG